MKLSELKRIGFDATAKVLKTKWFGGRPCVQFGAIALGAPSPIALDQEQFEQYIDRFIKRFGDVQAGTSHELGKVRVVPRCAEYEMQFSPEKVEEMRNEFRKFGTNV